jgi:hypothetical protein
VVLIATSLRSLHVTLLSTRRYEYSVVSKSRCCRVSGRRRVRPTQSQKQPLALKLGHQKLDMILMCSLYAVTCELLVRSPWPTSTLLSATVEHRLKMTPWRSRCSTRNVLLCSERDVLHTNSIPTSHHLHTDKPNQSLEPRQTTS